MHKTDPLIAKFLDDRESLSEEELAQLVELLSASPSLAVELKQQLLMDEILAQRLAVDRQNFTAQVAQRISDLKRGDEEMHRQIQELRALASAELTAQSESRASRWASLVALAGALLIAVGLFYWQPKFFPEMLAVVDATHGNAQLIRDGRSQPVATSEQVFVGDRFETSSQQSLAVRYTDDTLVMVDGASSVEFGNQDEVAGKRIFIHRGSLAATVSPQAVGRPLVIRTETAEAKVLGTQFRLSRRGKLTRLEVLEGRVALLSLAGGEPQIIGSGQYGTVTETQGVSVGETLWPTTREGLAFLFETEDRGNLVREASTGRLRSCRVTPRGAAHLDHNFALALRGGSFVARGVADNLLEACRRSGQLTLLITVDPLEATNSPGGILASFTSEPGLINFQLSQVAEQLQFQIRTRMAEQDLLNQPLTVCSLPADRAAQVALVYQPGRLICAVDGQTVLNSDAIQGDLSNWHGGHLVFGSTLTGSQPWKGTLEGMALYSCALSESEITAQSQAYKQVLSERQSPDRLEVQATLVETSQDPTLDDMAPEQAALRVDKYRVDQVLAGIYAQSEIYVARWAYLDGKAEPGLQIGKAYSLVLEPFEANPQLADFVCRDDFLATSPATERYFAVNTP